MFQVTELSGTQINDLLTALKNTHQIKVDMPVCCDPLCTAGHESEPVATISNIVELVRQRQQQAAEQRAAEQQAAEQQAAEESAEQQADRIIGQFTPGFAEMMRHFFSGDLVSDQETTENETAQRDEAEEEAKDTFILLEQREGAFTPKVHGIITSTRSTLNEKVKEVSTLFPGVTFTVTEFIGTAYTPKTETTIGNIIPF